ncbi:bifunctional UDP-sugar hydrolase/5'-nucleotidase [Vitiosangium sp. GDMCC 1.1324]|uniref:bifunctional metallophosphatase/5'-nucleotidase n=1 Tax=Vitiosangium sp. (strain GDMCC 1.1324) TaxID=2138576 RepID=UPI000D3B5BE4|nr:bifunctional metallophosphatase/5'-nucleotidase [Vitiosangium sp. GDMCC 1.1324]PTL75554.1 bifunctional metallophosphatase/5'-nucleotidase [Vitiosangium sp. GDMCC 1.1324]
MSPPSPSFLPPRHALLLAAVLLVSCAHGGGQAPGAAADRAAHPRQVHVRVLGINDFHGNLAPPAGSSGEIRTGTQPDGSALKEKTGGMSFLARHLAELRAKDPKNTLVVSSGDLIGASPVISALFHDEPTIEAMNLAGLQLNAVGNHELDEGATELLRMQNGGCHPVDGCQDGTPFEGARFQFLAANIVDGQGKTLFPAYAVREFEGVKVAFIGMTLKGTPEIVAAAGIQGLQFRDEAETVNALVPELKKQGVRAIIILVHEGGNQNPSPGPYDGCEGFSGAIVDIVHRLDPEVDAILSAHTHQAYNCVIDGKRVTSAASYGRLITDLELVLDTATGDVVGSSAHNILVTRDVEGVPDVQALIDRYDGLAAPLRDRVLGQTTALLQQPDNKRWPSGESPLGNTVSDAQLEATKDAGAQVAFLNPGGIRGDLDAGDVTYGEVFTLQPFGNSLVTMTLTGAQLHTLLEQQWEGKLVRILQPSRGFSYTWKASAPVGQKVDPRSLRLQGAPVDPAGRYRVTVNSFLAGGGDGFRVLTEGTERRGGPVDLDALEAWMKTHSPIAPPETNRITRVE